MSRPDRKDSEISPGTVPPRAVPANARGNIAPWESDSSSGQVNNYSGNIPTINRQPPSATQQSGTNERPTQMLSSVFGSFYNDSNENLGAISPGSTGYMGDGDDRRPSIASATTVSSTGSQPKSNVGGKFQKKLQGFFGEEYKGLQEESRQNSETSSMQSSQPNFTPGSANTGPRGRHNSFNDARGSGPPSPSDSRPRTPGAGPNSEVTPWVFQDAQVRYI